MSTSDPFSRNPSSPEKFHFVSFEGNSRVTTTADFQLQTFDDIPGEQFSFLGIDLQNQTRDILAAAQMQAQEVERQAYENGFAQGQKDGQEIGKKSLDQLMQRFQGMIIALEGAKEELHRNREQALLQLILIIGKKVVGRELSLKPESLLAVIEQGLQHLAETERVRLLVNPQDLERLTEMAPNSWPAGIELVPEATITAGGFVLESPRGNLDGTWENRWAKVSRVVEEALENLDADRPPP